MRILEKPEDPIRLPLNIRIDENDVVIVSLNCEGDQVVTGTLDQGIEALVDGIDANTLGLGLSNSSHERVNIPNI
jgi:hypothetical protein